MKTHSIEWTDINSGRAAATRNPVGRLNSVLQIATKTFLALVPALDRGGGSLACHGP